MLSRSFMVYEWNALCSLDSQNYFLKNSIVFNDILTSRFHIWKPKKALKFGPLCILLENESSKKKKKKTKLLWSSQSTGTASLKAWDPQQGSRAHCPSPTPQHITNAYCLFTAVRFIGTSCPAAMKKDIQGRKHNWKRKQASEPALAGVLELSD